MNMTRRGFLKGFATTAGVTLALPGVVLGAGNKNTNPAPTYKPANHHFPEFWSEKLIDSLYHSKFLRVEVVTKSACTAEVSFQVTHIPESDIYDLGRVELCRVPAGTKIKQVMVSPPVAE